MNKAFTYDWRYWSLPELTELLKEAGFADAQVFWDKSNDNDTENYQPTRRAHEPPGVARLHRCHALKVSLFQPWYV